MKKIFGSAVTVYLPSPTWGNHHSIAAAVGLPVVSYRYYASDGRNELDFAGLCEDLEAAPRGSMVLLHPCAHNPTGCDPNMMQWRVLSELIMRKQLIVFFDCAYQVKSVDIH